jgi:hypothetical protein
MLTTNAAAPGAEGLDAPTPTGVLRRRELEIAEEIAHSFLSATHPLEVCRLALARVTPLVGARFASVYLRDPADPTLLKLNCAHNWPQDSARFLCQPTPRSKWFSCQMYIVTLAFCYPGARGFSGLRSFRAVRESLAKRTLSTCIVDVQRRIATTDRCVRRFDQTWIL